jgi:signal transduction histidine kinase
MTPSRSESSYARAVDGIERVARRLGSTRLDLLLAIGFVVVGLAQVVAFPIGARGVGEVFVLGTTLPLAWRRTYAVEAAVASSIFWLIPTEGFPVLGFVVAVLIFYGLGAHGVGDRAVVIASAWGIGTGVVGTLRGPEPAVAAIGSALVVLFPVVAGRIVALQQRQNADLRRLTEELAAEREKVRESAVTAERARIAQELHDVLGHEVTLIAVQAEAASAALATAPERAVQPVETIRTTAHRTLTEMRAVLGAIDPRSGGHQDSPTPGPAALEDLLVRARAHGIPVVSTSTGEPWAGHTGVWLALVRLVRECVTNAGRHAPGAEVHVRTTWAAELVVLEVANDVPADVSDGVPGRGLQGMRNRAELMGGTFAARIEDGRYVVRAGLPPSARGAS